MALYEQCCPVKGQHCPRIVATGDVHICDSLDWSQHTGVNPPLWSDIHDTFTQPFSYDCVPGICDQWRDCMIHRYTREDINRRERERERERNIYSSDTWNINNMYT